MYAKQSYSTYIICEFPDAYVDPYPEVFERLVQSSELGLSLVDRLQRASGKKLDGVRAYFQGAKQTFSKLQLMAERQLQGKRLTAEQLDFVNKMIVAHHRSGDGCGGGGVSYSGWYKQLFYTADIADPDFSIADVHTSKGAFFTWASATRCRRSSRSTTAPAPAYLREPSIRFINWSAVSA